MDIFYSSSFTKVESYNGIHLLQDHRGTNHDGPWNDYGYVITFRVYYTFDDKMYNIGNIKVLVNGAVNTSKYFTEHGNLVENDIYHINELMNPDNLVSLATDIDFYIKLRKVLGKENVVEYLTLICDAGYNYNNFTIYKEWPGFDSSVFRNSSASQAILKKGYQIAIGNYAPEEIFNIKIDTLPETFEPIDFHFDNSRAISKTNVNLIIGRNGVGKTHILKHLIDLMTGIVDTEEQWPYFHKLIVAAYSPFEDFYTESLLLKKLEVKFNKKEASKNSPIRSGSRKLKVNKYSYIGFRNKNDVFDLEWPKEHSSQSLIKVLRYDEENNWWNEKNRLNILIQTLRLTIDFDFICIKTKDSKLIKIENFESIKAIKVDNEIDFKSGIIFVKNNVELSLSSGQMIYSYMLPALVAEIEDESLLVLDEPELYLHPSIEVGLINMIKHLLTETSSYAIIATHSAVLAREVAQNGINILRTTTSNMTQVSLPSFETYGESLDLIIGEAFEDYSIKKPYQSDLDLRISNYDTINEAISELGPDIGDEALCYIISKSDSDKVSNIVLENC